VELQDEENREEAGGGEAKTVTSDKEEMREMGVLVSCSKTLTTLYAVLGKPE